MLANSSPALSLRSGDVVSDEFEIRGLLGKGGMGQVFEAYDRKLHRMVALKVGWPHAVASVHNEARALAALRHPTVLSVYGLGVHEGMEYVVTERVRGLTMEAYLERCRLEKVRVPLAEVIRLLIAIAEGLAFVHAAGIAHRDVKPDNIMLAGPRVVLTDFGIFRPESGSPTVEDPIGAPPYMAPETILRTIAPGEAYLVDIYALGVIAYELLTGVLPFWGRTAARIFELHLTEPPPDPALFRHDAPPRLAQLIQSMLAKDPNSRPQGAAEVVWRLRRVSTESLASDDAFTVVIAEDNPATATILEALVRAAVPDAKVHVAPDGAQALALVQRCQPSLLVVDLNLPVMSGLEVCARLREGGDTTHCTVICTSAITDDSKVARLREIGLRRYAPKGEKLLRQLPELALEVRRRWQLGRPVRACGPRPQ